MQPTGWQPAGWDGQPAPGATAPPPGWGDQAPGFANPAPTWGPTYDHPAPPAPPEPRGTGWTVAAHLVLWIGLLVVAATTNPLLRPLIEAGVPYSVVSGAVTVYQLLPVVIALVLAGRSALLRGLGAAVGVVLVGVAVLWSFEPGVYEVGWVARIVAYVFALGGWMMVRRHARPAYLLLGVLALLLLLWFPIWGPAPEIRNIPIQQGIRSPFLLSLWFDLPVLVAAAVGGIASLLRPRPTRAGDVVGIAVVGGLAALFAVTVALSFVLDAVR